MSTWPGSAASGDDSSNPTAWSARVLAAALRRRRVSAREVLDAHLERIDDVNDTVNAVVTLDADRAHAAALAADERAARSEADTLPPLHGIPVTHKDTHEVAGCRTTHGSAVVDHVSTFDDLIVARLREAGVVSTGKSNVPEFAAGSHTFNDVFGTTRNPYDPTRSAGGSSGGAAVAVATRIQAFSDGSDMGGSLRNPAAWNNVVGYRPSVGVVPLVPTRDAWSWLARTGPLARDVADIALVMTAIAGADPAVAHPCPVRAADYAPLITGDPAASLAGLRVGVTNDFGLDVPVEPEVAAAVQASADVLAGLGAYVEVSCPSLRDADTVFDVTRAFDMALALREVVARHGDAVKEEVRWNVARGVDLTAVDLMRATAARTRLRAAVAAWFTDFDVLLAPTTQLMPFDANLRYPEVVAGRPMTTYVEWMRSCSLVSAMGGPAVSVPAGFVGGLPVGVQLVGADGDDVRLLRVAQAFEQATGHAARTPA